MTDLIVGQGAAEGKPCLWNGKGSQQSAEVAGSQETPTVQSVHVCTDVAAVQYATHAISSQSMAWFARVVCEQQFVNNFGRAALFWEILGREGGRGGEGERGGGRHEAIAGTSNTNLAP